MRHFFFMFALPLSSYCLRCASSHNRQHSIYHIIPGIEGGRGGTATPTVENRKNTHARLVPRKFDKNAMESSKKKGIETKEGLEGERERNSCICCTSVSRIQFGFLFLFLFFYFSLFGNALHATRTEKNLGIGIGIGDRVARCGTDSLPVRLEILLF